MIQADTRELEAKLRQTVLGIREKEVSLFTDQFSVLASSATFMSSLGFGALNMEIGFLERSEDGKYCSELVGCDGRWDRVLAPMALFYTFAAAGVAFNLLAVILASFCMIFGPELAIRGTEESMHFAVRGMYDERRQAVKFFWIGCLFIVLSGVALGWMKFPQLTAVIITLVFGALIALCVLYARRLRPKFAYVESDDWSEMQSTVEGVAHGHAYRDTASQRRLSQQARQRGSDSRYGTTGNSAALLSAAQQLQPSPPLTTAAAPPRGGTSSSSGQRAHSGDAGLLREKSGNVFVDGMLRYAVFADGVFRLFTLDGRQLASHAAVDVRVGRDKFWLPGLVPDAPDLLDPSPSKKDPSTTASKKYQVCTGTTDRDTAAWLQVLDAASTRLAHSNQGFDETHLDHHESSFIARLGGGSGRRGSALPGSKSPNLPSGPASGRR